MQCCTLAQRLHICLRTPLLLSHNCIGPMIAPMQHVRLLSNLTCRRACVQAAQLKVDAIIAEHKAQAGAAKPSAGSMLSNIASTVAQAVVGGGEVRVVAVGLKVCAALHIEMSGERVLCWQSFQCVCLTIRCVPSG